jgi:hypothetical protein
MKLKTGIAVLSLNGLLVLLVGQAVRGEAPPVGPPPVPTVQASVTLPQPQAAVVVEGALSSNTRGWSRVSQATVGATEIGVRPELVDAYWLAVAASPPACQLTVSLLAAIGQVESGNLVGHRLDSRHRAVPDIIGPVLDGKRFDAIEDTDDGRLDSDTVWDRAVGPMQFVPASWRVAGVDMDGDGRRDPQDVDDAAGTAMVYLCAGGRDLGTAEGMREAVLSYNHSADYLRLVLAWKTFFDDRPLTGWAASPVLDTWQLPPVTPAMAPSPPATAVARTPAVTARPVPPVPGGTPANSPATAVTPSTAPSAKPSPTPSPAPTLPAPAPTGASTPAAAPDPDPKPDPTPEQLPPCPVPTPMDPSATPAPADPTSEPSETPGQATGGTPGDTTEPPECVPAVDPETGLPVTPAPDAVPTTGPDAGNDG